MIGYSLEESNYEPSRLVKWVQFCQRNSQSLEPADNSLPINSEFIIRYVYILSALSNIEVLLEHNPLIDFTERLVETLKSCSAISVLQTSTELDMS